MITLIESLVFLNNSDDFGANKSSSRFSSPQEALMGVLSTPQLVSNHADNVTSNDYAQTNSRADNGFATEEFNNPHFKI